MSNLPCSAEEVDFKELDETVPDPASGLYFECLRFALGLRCDSTALTRVNYNAIL